MILAFCHKLLARHFISDFTTGSDRIWCFFSVTVVHAKLLFASVMICYLHGHVIMTASCQAPILLFNENYQWFISWSTIFSQCYSNEGCNDVLEVFRWCYKRSNPHSFALEYWWPIYNSLIPSWNRPAGWLFRLPLSDVHRSTIR